jgi:hypothetical protein
MRRLGITISWQLFLLPSTLLAQSLAPIAINDNHKPSGILRDGVLTIQLEIAKGEWQPEAEDGIAVRGGFRGILASSPGYSGVKTAQKGSGS